ncbi:hypothetical protein [Vibrio jasicida]|uniref:hypothetical protein n=1 Tax=Vibrio jasicida TaxID=766224 RepID=UPI0005F01D9A|nr:hypothetical protein [Vibrio jasicida]
MSETANIAKMAELVSKNLFSAFKWGRKEAQDHSWDCVTPEEHDDKDSHPSDCVFHYRDPYDNQVKYVNTDLKSYQKTSINKVQIRKAMHSLTYATNCAQYNPNWQALYKPVDSHQVHGMLFVYNHCGKYNGNFDDILDDVNQSDKERTKVNHLEGYSQVYVMSPEKITELNSIAKDLKLMTADGLLPQSDKYCFFHPSETLNKNHYSQDYSEPATLEVLFSSWIIVKHDKAENTDAGGYVIYYMEQGDTVEEFVYLLDALSYYQILNDKGSVKIKLVKRNKNGALNLQAAIAKYFGDLGYSEEQIKELKEELKANTIDKFVPQFSDVEVGLM